MKLLVVCRSRVLMVVLVAFVSTACLGRELEVTPRVDVLSGEYHGELWADAMRDAVTVFYGETRNGLDGSYRFEYDDGLEEGVLVNCKRLKAQEFRCGWKDRWGLGQLDLKFSADFNAFTGVWSDVDNPPSLGLRWHGARR